MYEDYLETSWTSKRTLQINIPPCRLRQLASHQRQGLGEVELLQQLQVRDDQCLEAHELVGALLEAG